MRRLKAHILILCFLGVFGSLTTAQSKETIHWLIWDLPPEFIKNGPYAYQGYADKFLKTFTDHLSDYNHHIDRVNVPRWSTEVLRPKRCSAHLWGGFFKDKITLSKPYTFTPPHVAIFHKRNAHLIGQAGTEISLEELLKQENLKLMTMRLEFNQDAGQSRYPVLYPYLKPYIGSPNLIEQSDGRNVVDLRLLKRERADYTLGYPYTILTQQRTVGLPDDEYVSYPLKEHNLYKKVYVACNNDEFGNKIIKRLNGILTKDTLRKFLSYHDEWNQENSRFHQTYIDYFINEIPLENVID